MVIKAVVFDFGGVLMSFNGLSVLWEELAENFGVSMEDLSEKKDEIWSFIVNSSDIMRGRISAEEFEENALLTKCNQLLGTSVTSPPRFVQNLVDKEKIEHNKCMMAFLKDVREKGILTGLLTNNLHIDKERQKQRVAIDMSLFDIVTESCMVGMQKPNQDIYEFTHNLLLSKCPSILPSEVLFLDDFKENIEAAEEFGWKTVWVNSRNPQESADLAEELLGTENEN